jgi:hypothetical protein
VVREAENATERDHSFIQFPNTKRCSETGGHRTALQCVALLVFIVSVGVSSLMSLEAARPTLVALKIKNKAAESIGN